MFMPCAAAAPTRHPPGEAYSLLAPAPLVTTFAAGPLPVSRASEVASRRLAAHTMGTRRPLSSPLSLSATPQLQPAQPLPTRVAKNAIGDTTRHATDFALPLTASMVSTKSTPPELANKIDVAALATLANMADSRKTALLHPATTTRANTPSRTTNQERENRESPRIFAKGTSLAANSSFAPIRVIRGHPPYLLRFRK